MRFIYRPNLKPATVSALQKKQDKVNREYLNANFNAVQTWKIASKTKVIATVRNILKVMAAKRERCMYCEDSHGTDIEHFWPKTSYPDKMFKWENFLLCCTECGRFKGIQFPLDGMDAPLLIDPTSDNPWDFLEFDPKTGNISARFDVQCNDYFPKGVTTVGILKLNCREALSYSYRRSYIKIVSEIKSFTPVASLKRNAANNLIRKLQNIDDFRLLGWCFKYSGRNDSPFREFIAEFPIIARKIIASF